jgi:hypothetical protein
VAGARVYFASGPGAFPDLAALTDAQGAFALGASNPGEYVIEASADAYAPGRVTVTVRDRDVDVAVKLTRRP